MGKWGMNKTNQTEEKTSPASEAGPEKISRGRWNLFRLGKQENGEERWSIGVNGPRAYLTCDEDVAMHILKALDLSDYITKQSPTVYPAS
jgi:hypothetical protein